MKQLLYYALPRTRKALCAALAAAAVISAPASVWAAQELHAPPAALGALDWVFLLMAGYIVWRIVSRMRNNKDQGQPPNSGQSSSAQRSPSPDEDGGEDRRNRAAQAAWQYLTGEKGPDTASAGAPQIDIPGTFNEVEFLRGAKMMYGRIRQSLAMRNMADLAQFAAPDMLRTMEEQARQDPERQALLVLLVDAQVKDLKRDGKRTEVTVAYDATISDDPKTNANRKVSEVWIFSRDETVDGAKWLLESIES